MFDLQEREFGFDEMQQAGAVSPGAARRHTLGKTVFDLSLSLILLGPLAIAALILVILNPFLNPGPLLFRQRRMGRECQPFTAFKFRTMTPGTAGPRGAFDPLETDRISGFARLLRRMRIDELPQIINVLRGEMSLIGPRPDAYDHARVYLRDVPGYAQRHQVAPGISGYAQTEVGYVDGPEGIRRKVAADHYYLTHASLAFDLWITWRTLRVVFGAKGS